MQRYRREWLLGATYFFTVNTYQRQSLLTTPPFYQELKSAIREVKDSHPFEIEAFVLLPDHLHCIWTMPADNADYSLRWSMIKRKVSQRCRGFLKPNATDSRTKRREISLWQRRFWERRIRDDRDFEMHVNYIHYNPVKHGYTKEIRAWPYSSFHSFVRKGILPLDWCGAVESSDGKYGEA